MKKCILFFLMACLMPFASIAQNKVELSNEEIKEFEERTKVLLTDFQSYLTEIGDKSNDDELKNYYIKRALRLFMGEGEAYEIDDQYYKPVHMQVSSLRNGIETKRNVPMKQYLQTLKRLRYSKVKIERADCVRLSNLYKVGDHYEGTAVYFQLFRGYNGDRISYTDKTRKTVKVFLIPEYDDWGRHWDVKFGDVDVAETTAN